MKYFVIFVMFFLSSNVFAGESHTIRIAIQPTFGAHQHIGYEIIERLPKTAKKYGINQLDIIKVPTKSSIKGNMLLINGQIDINVGSLTSFILLDNKLPNQGRLLTAVGHYKFFLLCTNDIKTMFDVKKTKIVTSGRNTVEHHTIRWLAKKHFGDPYALESNFITMPRPQIWQILKVGSKDIKCVMTGSPLQNKIKNELGLNIIDSSDVEQGIAGSYNAYWTSTKFAEENPALVNAYIETAVQVIKDYNTTPLPILEKFISKDNMETTAKQLLKGHEENKANFHYDLKGSEYFNDFLHEIGFVTGRKSNLSKLLANPKLLR